MTWKKSGSGSSHLTRSLSKAARSWPGGFSTRSGSGRRTAGLEIPFTANTPYVNTIPASQEAAVPGDQEMERRIKSLIRWNALAMVVRANRVEHSIGGHISTYASAATLFEIGFNHFFRGAHRRSLKATPFISRATPLPASMPARFSKAAFRSNKLENFRRELKPGGGLSSYPHPWLMPDFWEYPTVSMGLSPIMAIYQARFNRYLENRGLKPATDAKVWAFLGDGETDEPETLGAITLASRENLDNLIFVINCNLQRLDGPVRGNGKIIQELEAAFRGAGWNVIKVIWGSRLGSALRARYRRPARQAPGRNGGRRIRRSSVVESGAYVREHVFGSDPRLLEMVEDYSRRSSFARCARAATIRARCTRPTRRQSNTRALPPSFSPARSRATAWAKAAKGKNVTHQQKKLNEEELRQFRHAFRDSHQRRPDCRGALLPSARRQPGDPIPAGAPRRSWAAMCRSRSVRSKPLVAESRGAFRRILTPAARAAKFPPPWPSSACCGKMLRDPEIGKLVVPIVPDEARTFGMESLFRQCRHLQQPRPALRTRRYPHAALLQGSEGRPDSRRRHHRSRLDGFVHRRRLRVRHPRHQHHSFFIYYSMFGLQRIGDLIWAAADMRCRGFLLGGTAGRTTLVRRRSAAPGRQQPRPGAARFPRFAPTILRLPTRLP